MTSPVHIQLRQCSRTFNHTQVLKPLDLDIYRGETLVLLGPSGCGKTTTLRIISGLESPNVGGEIWFDSKNVTHLPIEKRNVGMVFQHYALFPNFNVAENIAYSLKIQKLPKAEIESRVREMLDMVDLADHYDRPIETLSGGQKQRVSLARALAARPQILLFDEPLAALDVKLKDKLREDISRLLKKLNITAIYVTHDQQEAMALGDRIAVMNQGKIEQIGTAQEIYHQPKTAFVANFIGTTNQVEIQGQTYCCRPEDIQINQSSTPFNYGTVIEKTFLGQTQQISIAPSNGETIKVTCSAHEPLQIGQNVTLHIHSDRLFQI